MIKKLLFALIVFIAPVAMAQTNQSYTVQLTGASQTSAPIFFSGPVSVLNISLSGVTAATIQVLVGSDPTCIAKPILISEVGSPNTTGLTAAITGPDVYQATVAGATCFQVATTSGTYQAGATLTFQMNATPVGSISRNGAPCAPDGSWSCLWEDFYTSVLWTTQTIGSPAASMNNAVSCGLVNHPGCDEMESGTTAGAGIALRTNEASSTIFSIRSNAPPWVWECDLQVPVLPTTTASSYQAGLANTINVDPWITAAQFYLSDTNSTPGDWYIRYVTTSQDSGVAATTGFVRLRITSDSSTVRWFINGIQVYSVAASSMYASPVRPAFAVATHTASTDVNLFVDYATFQMNVMR